METYLDFIEKISANIKILDMEEKLVLKCLGQVAAEDIYSTVDLPVRDSSGPDGYAVRYDDVKNANNNNPVTLKIIETVKAGSVARREVVSGTAIRIMTGCLLPEGADCVIRFEDTDEPGDKNGPNKNNPREVKIYLNENPEFNIRKAGTSVASGTLLVPKGAMLGPAQIATLLTVGKTAARVIRRPVIAVISTGDELIKVNQPLLPGKVYDCNTAAVTALIKHYGGIPVFVGIARDSKRSLADKIMKGLTSDAIITSGGVSRGDYDLVRLILEGLGKIVFSRIPMGPGGSFTFGNMRRQQDGNGTKNDSVPVFALSGPPVGCMNNMEFFVRPALQKMRGCKQYRRPFVEAIAEDSIYNSKPVPFIVWGKLKKDRDIFKVKLSWGKEGFQASMSLANSQVILPANAVINPGDKVQVTPLDWTEG